jgi:hypothetical protein
MDQLTVRGFDKALAQRIREVARERGISLNQAAVLLLRQGAGLAVSGRRSGRVADSLGKLIGAWNKTQAEDFRRALQPLEQIDAELWK